MSTTMLRPGERAERPLFESADWEFSTIQRCHDAIEAIAVGDSRFAERARAIHRGEAEPKGIYGEATEEQAESLADDGIEVARIPWVPRADG